MICCLALAWFATWRAAATLPAAVAQSQGNPYLIASPFEGHAGDAFYLSGFGLPPKSRLYLLMTCPAIFDPSVFPNGNYMHIASSDGPLTDKYGNFTHFLMHAIHLNKISSSLCYIYEEIGGQESFNTVLPAQYAILPNSQRAVPCALRICARLQVSMRKVHHVAVERVQIAESRTPWPGATARIVVSYRGLNPMVVNRTLDVRGGAAADFPIPSNAAQGAPASVWATFKLGRFVGTTRHYIFTLPRSTPDSDAR